MKEIPPAFREVFSSRGLHLQALGSTGDLPEISPLRRASSPPGNCAFVLIGNHRRMWAVFLGALRSSPNVLKQDHPLDSWLSREIPAMLMQLRHEIPPVRTVFYPWETDARRVDFQELGRLSGLAALGPSMLSVHPIYGPWIAWRAAILFDASGPPLPKPELEPCGSCLGRACMAGFDSLKKRGYLESNWRSWLAIRDSCPIGRKYRYSQDQMLYHYTKNRNILYDELDRIKAKHKSP